MENVSFDSVPVSLTELTFMLCCCQKLKMGADSVFLMAVDSELLTVNSTSLTITNLGSLIDVDSLTFAENTRRCCSS